MTVVTTVHTGLIVIVVTVVTEVTVVTILTVSNLTKTKRYSPLRGLLLAPAEGFGLRPRLFCPNLVHFWCSIVTSVMLSSNLSNFEKKSKISLQNTKISSKNFKKSNNLKKSKKIQTNLLKKKIISS